MYSTMVRVMPAEEERCRAPPGFGELGEDLAHVEAECARSRLERSGLTPQNVRKRKYSNALSYGTKRKVRIATVCDVAVTWINAKDLCRMRPDMQTTRLGEQAVSREV